MVEESSGGGERLAVCHGSYRAVRVEQEEGKKQSGNPAQGARYVNRSDNSSVSERAKLVREVRTGLGEAKELDTSDRPAIYNHHFHFAVGLFDYLTEESLDGLILGSSALTTDAFAALPRKIEAG